MPTTGSSPLTPDLRLLGIACPQARDIASLTVSCCQAEAGGATAMQLRWKDAGGDELLRATEALINALTIPVFVNDRVDVALAAGAVGVHLGADDIPPMAVRPFAGRPFAIGVSVGDPAEAANVAHADVDYWSVGSIYHTRTKRDAGSPIGPEGFQDLVTLAPPNTPVLAIGGITASNAPEILEAGAHGIAVSSAIFDAGDVERSTQELRMVVDRMTHR